MYAFISVRRQILAFQTVRRYIYLSIYLSVCLSICLSVCLSVLSVCLYLSIYLSIHPSIHLSIHLPFHPYHIMSISFHIISYRIISYHIISYHVLFLCEHESLCLYLYRYLYVYTYLLYRSSPQLGLAGRFHARLRGLLASRNGEEKTTTPSLNERFGTWEFFIFLTRVEEFSGK